MSRFSGSKLVGVSKKLLAIFLSVLSFGGTVAYGKVCGGANRVCITEDDQNMGRGLAVGIMINNPRYVDLRNQIGNLEEINKEELVRIFENEFWNIVLRDERKITRFRMQDVYKEVFRNFIHVYERMILQPGPHFINLLFSGSLFILLNEGPDGIENMKEDFRNWGHPDISVNDLYNYFIQKIEIH